MCTVLCCRAITRLAIVGHSLGAGVASLLALLMRHEFPTLHCYGYGSPGSTMDAVTAHEAKSYVTSVVLGDDMVGSLSFHSLSVLREQVGSHLISSRSSLLVLFSTHSCEVAGAGLYCSLEKLKDVHSADYHVSRLQ